MVAPSKSLRDLFDTIVDLPIDQRNAFIEQYCKDAQTRQQLEELLLHDTLNTADSFVSPVLHLVPQNRTAEPAAGFISEIVDLGMIGQVLDNRYRIVEVVGQGGVGIVFRAEQIAPVKRGVAVKVLKPGMDTARIIARFESERQRWPA